MVSVISSLTNSEIKHIVKLHDAKYRKQYLEFIVEGLRANQTVSAKLELVKLYVTEKEGNRALSFVHQQKMGVVSDSVMKKISVQSTPAGFVGIYKIPQITVFKDLANSIVLAQISDPGNMGTLIRTAAACNVKNIIIVDGVDPWSPKVIAASAGTIAFVNIISLSWQELLQIKGNLKLAALAVSNGESIKKLDINKAILVISNEAHGLPVEWLDNCEQKITLPMPGGTESLNAAVAGSIAMYIAYVN